MRARYKAIRQAIDKSHREEAAQLVTKFFIESAVFNEAAHIACYFSIHSELDTNYLLNEIRQAGKSCYLPVLHLATQSMRFAGYQHDTILKKNAYNILEPAEPLYFPAEKLDIVLLPLLSFDKNGTRLGMGGGFYDKTFDFVRKKKKVRTKPLLIGLAFSEQESEDLPRDEWDVMLDAIITQKGIFYF